MRRSVVAKLWLVCTGLVLFLLIPLEFALDRLLTDFYATQVTEPLLYHSEQLAGLLAVDPEAIQMAPMMARMTGGEVLVLDRNGRLVDFPGSSRTPPPAEAVTRVLAGSPFVGQVRPDQTRESFIVTAVPVPRGGGAVLLFAPAEPLQHSLRLARRYLWLAGAGTLLVGTGLALMLSRGLLRPVIAIEQATRQIARGDFSTRVEVTATDEIGQLSAAVNQMTAQLAAYETRRREFLANVAHELRTPLAYIQGYTQAIAEGLVSPEERARYQRVVHEEAVRISRLVGDLMDLAQLEEGQMAMDQTPVDLYLPIEQAAATMRPRAEVKGVQVTTEVPADLPQITADGGRVQQVVFNLLDNALRHTPTGGAINISAAAAAGWITVRVTDTGPGVEPAMLPLIFERFHKGHGSGKGLGLAIVRSIVRAHGGEVGAENRPGGGAAIWFRLPLTPRAAQRENPAVD